MKLHSMNPQKYLVLEMFGRKGKTLSNMHKGTLMQMSMMATPEINKELHYLNKEDRLLRWLLVKQRNTKFGLDVEEDEGRLELSKFDQISKLDEEDEDENDDDEEFQLEEEESVN